MCLLIVAPAGHTPDRDAIEESARMNDDGFGFAIATPDRGILRGRGMDLDAVCDWYYQLRDMYPQAHSMFHLRMTTHGRTAQDNCHPFLVAGRDDIALGHNGILPIDIPNGDHRSDTRILAEDFFGEWGIRCLDDPQFMDELGLWAKGSKLAILSTTDELDKDFYIVNEDDGHWLDGIWFSNYSYEPYTSYGRYNYKSSTSGSTTFNRYGRTGYTPSDGADDDGAEYEEWLEKNQKFCDDYWWEVDETGVPAELSDPYYTSKDGTRQATWDKTNGRYIEGSIEIEGRELVEMRCWHCDTDCSIDVSPDSTFEDDFCPNCQSCIFCGDYYVACKCDHHSHRPLSSPVHAVPSLEDGEDECDMSDLIRQAAVALNGGSSIERAYQRALWEHE